MAFPNVDIVTTNLDSDSDSPAAARVQILQAVQALNIIIAGAGSADGVALLDSAGAIGSGQLPSTIAPFGVLTLAPGDGFVKIENILRLQFYTTALLNAVVGTAAGDVAFVIDGDAGDPCIAVNDGTDWLRISLGTAISAT
jgi:hypothetical protein